MKAMLYADWMNFRQSIRSILFVLVVFALSAFAFSGPMFFNFTVVFLSIMVPTTLFAADQAYGWNRLSLSMPILRRDVVGSKFVMGALVNVILLAVSTVLTVVYVLISATGNPAGALMENLAGIFACEAVAFLMMGVVRSRSSSASKRDAISSWRAFGCRCSAYSCSNGCRGLKPHYRR